MSKWRIIDIIESTITVDESGHGWRPDTVRLLHLLKFDDITGVEEDVKSDGGNPKKYKIQIQINLKECEPPKENE